jgi:hypothetical protein
MDEIKIPKKDFIELLKLFRKISKKTKNICEKANIDFEKRLLIL